MSFWSSLSFVRAAAPPVVTVAEIGKLVAELAATRAAAGNERPKCRIKYGPRVDADEQTTEVIEWDATGIIGTVGEYDWDRSDEYDSLTALSDALSSDNGSVYRAYLSLGGLHPEIVAALTRDPSPENKIGLCLHGLSFSIGPALVAGLESEAPAFAGWMELSFSGPGYYFPWTYRQARERAEAVGLVREVMSVCRRTWPVPPAPPAAAAVDGRRQLADLWLYDDFALSADWLWFASESG